MASQRRCSNVGAVSPCYDVHVIAAFLSTRGLIKMSGGMEGSFRDVSWQQEAAGGGTVGGNGR